MQIPHPYLAACHRLRRHRRLVSKGTTGIASQYLTRTPGSRAPKVDHTIPTRYPRKVNCVPQLRPVGSSYIVLPTQIFDAMPTNAPRLPSSMNHIQDSGMPKNTAQPRPYSQHSSGTLYQVLPSGPYTESGLASDVEG